jgi:hypothetical protein
MGKKKNKKTKTPFNLVGDDPNTSETLTKAQDGTLQESTRVSLSIPDL